MASSPGETRGLIAIPWNRRKWISDIQRPLLTYAFQECSVIRSGSEAGPYPHLDLAWAVALGLGRTPIRSTLEAEAGVSEVQVVHAVGYQSRKLHDRLFVYYEPLL